VIGHPAPSFFYGPILIIHRMRFKRLSHLLVDRSTCPAIPSTSWDGLASNWVIVAQLLLWWSPVTPDPEGASIAIVSTKGESAAIIAQKAGSDGLPLPSLVL